MKLLKKEKSFEQIQREELIKKAMESEDTASVLNYTKAATELANQEKMIKDGKRENVKIITGIVGLVAGGVVAGHIEKQGLIVNTEYGKGLLKLLYGVKDRFKF